LFCGDEDLVVVLPLSRNASQKLGAGLRGPAFRPSEFLDVVPITPNVVIGVTAQDLVLERWKLKTSPEEGPSAGNRELQQRVPAGLSDFSGLISSFEGGLRLFVEHVALRLFLFAGNRIHAYDLSSLQALYTLTVAVDGEPLGGWLEEVELLARWDYGKAFLAYQQEGLSVSMWSTSDGKARGKIEAVMGLLCCDISHAEVGTLEAGVQPLTSAVAVTLEVDGEIRLFKEEAGGHGECEWRQFGSVQSVGLIVEVKLERKLMLALSHREDGSSGTVHVWDLAFEGAVSYRSREFARTGNNNNNNIQTITITLTTKTTTLTTTTTPTTLTTTLTTTPTTLTTTTALPGLQTGLRPGMVAPLWRCASYLKTCLKLGFASGDFLMCCCWFCCFLLLFIFHFCVLRPKQLQGKLGLARPGCYCCCHFCYCYYVCCHCDVVVVAVVGGDSFFVVVVADVGGDVAVIVTMFVVIVVLVVVIVVIVVILVKAWQARRRPFLWGSLTFAG
ncbi:unnamed protein product, partial [Polarella glacialis]